MADQLPPPPQGNMVDANGNFTNPYDQWLNLLRQAINDNSTNFAPTEGTYLLRTPNSSLPGAQTLYNLQSGFVKVTNGTGYLTSQTTINSDELTATGISPTSFNINGQSFLTVNAAGQLTNASDITISATPLGAASGDLSGTYPSPTVSYINGVLLGSTTATSGQVLIGDGSQWNTTAINGDATLNSSGSLVVTKTNGVSFAPSATTDTTNASNISSGTLPAARLPNPSSSTLGGIQSFAAVTHRWINAISTSGVPSATQPTVSDVTGAAASGANSDITSMTGLTGYIAAPLGVKGSSGNIVLGFSDQTPTPDYYVVIRNDSSGPYIQTSTTGIPLRLSSGEVDLFNNGGIGVSPAILGLYNGFGSYTKFTTSTSQVSDITYTFPLDYASTNNQILQSATDGTLSWSTPAYPSTSGTARKILVSDGTNIVYSTETYATPGTTGNVLTSDGTNWISSTPTSGGTVSSGTANQLAYYASSGTTVSGLSTANNSVVVTNGSGVPSLSTTLPSGLAATNLTLTTPSLGTVSSGNISACTSTSMVMVTPILGTPTSGNASNLTNIPVNQATGNLPITNLPSIAAHTLLANTTGSSAVPTAVTTNNFIQSLNIQTFTSNGTYTPTTGMIYCTIECVGGGGGGGGAAQSSSGGNAGGGGAGGYSKLIATAATIGASKAVTIGAGGTAGSAGNNNGSAGGDTSVGSLCIAKGGSGGGGAAANNQGASGAGGIAGTGTITFVGNGGGAGFFYNSGTNIGMAGGFGGCSAFGGGAKGNGNASTGTSASANSGSGGCGGNSQNNSPAGGSAGGNGGSGFVIITEYIAI